MDIMTEELFKDADAVLKSAFVGAKVEWDAMSPNDKISGWIIWDGFSRMDELDRQLEVSRALRAGLSPEKVRAIAAVFAITADELAAIHETGD